MGLTSQVPPYSEASLLMASPSSRESHDIVRPNPLEVFGGIGRIGMDPGRAL